MQTLLDNIKNNQPPKNPQGDNAQVAWQYWGEGVVCITPKDGYDRAVIVSAGIHGNETAPMELLEQLLQAIYDGTLILKVRLLAILGNPWAIRANRRYVNDDLNRLFVGVHKQYQQAQYQHDEAMRAGQLETWVASFIGQAHDLGRPCYHYDLHTAIKPSVLLTFALMPYSPNTLPIPNLKADLASFDKLNADKSNANTPNQDTPSFDLLGSLHAGGMQAIVWHSTTSTTFSQFSANCGAKSVTLELGKVAAFGQNNLSDFDPSYAMLKRLLSGDDFNQVSPCAKQFVISDIIIKQSEAFRLLVDSELPNFSHLNPHTPIAYDEPLNQTSITYQYDSPRYTLFLNATVKVGLRAAMLLQPLSNTAINLSCDV